MPMATVAVDERVLPLLKDASNADRNGFLPAVHVAKAANLLSRLQILLNDPLLEAADQHHHPQTIPFGGGVVHRYPVIAGRLAYGGGGGPLLHFVGEGHSKAPVRQTQRNDGCVRGYAGAD